MRIDSEEIIVSRIWDNHGKEVGYEQKGVLVRCKDCKWNPYTPHPYYTSEVVAGYIWCPAIADPAPDQHERYCSYGERKEQDDEE